MEIIQIDKLTKKYNGIPVLNEISASFHSGQSVAFVGRNGCGKSTLLKCIAKLVEPTAGKVIYNKQLLFHYVPEKFPKLPLSARSYLVSMGAMDGLAKKDIAQRIEELANDFFMEDLLDISMKNMSKGTLQKVGVIQALLKQPDVLLLDEPLSGQDSESQKIFIEKINELRKRGVTVFLSCHEEQLVNAIAEDVYTIGHGVLESYHPEKEQKTTGDM